jgi:hypothetical protein
MNCHAPEEVRRTAAAGAAATATAAAGAAATARCGQWNNFAPGALARGRPNAGHSALAGGWLDFGSVSRRDQTASANGHRLDLSSRSPRHRKDSPGDHVYSRVLKQFSSLLILFLAARNLVEVNAIVAYL